MVNGDRLAMVDKIAMVFKSTLLLGCIPSKLYGQGPACAVRTCRLRGLYAKIRGLLSRQIRPSGWWSRYELPAGLICAPPQGLPRPKESQLYQAVRAIQHVASECFAAQCVRVRE